VTRVVTAAAPQPRSEPAKHDDDLTWWHHQDELMQQLEEQQRIDACNRALNELKENDDAE
jgi:hypothetical protein